MATRPMYIIVGFDEQGNAVELGECQPSNPVAEAIIADYQGPLVNLHWVTREVDDSAATAATEPHPTRSEETTLDLTLPEEKPYVAPP